MFIKFGTRTITVQRCESFVYNADLGLTVLCIDILKADTTLSDMDALEVNKEPIYYYTTNEDADPVTFEGFYNNVVITMSNGQYHFTGRKASNVDIEINKLNNVLFPTIDVDTCTIDELKTFRNARLSEDCQNTIYAGIDVVTSIGKEHFSLTQFDQTLLNKLKNTVSNGATKVKYHADGSFCRWFTSTEISAVISAAEQFIFYNTSYCNILHGWVRRCITKDEILAITYGSTLPDDLLAQLNDTVSELAE